jgi:excinuclease ABC subunit C
MIDQSINKNIEHIKLKLKTIPETPGVYQYLDDSGKVIYVGKARNLQRRVTSYFNRYDDHTPKIKMLVRHICDLRITVVASEVDALLLENNLIKQYQPRYNSMLKDDKTYPYLCITDEDYPQLLFTRDRTRLKGQFFGPYPNQRILHELQDIIRKLFSYRKCKKKLTWDSQHQRVIGGDRPCMNHQIGLCKAPCVGLESHDEYMETIGRIRKILRGDFGEILDAMKKEMMDLADQLRYEEAEIMRRKIRLLEEYQYKSTVVNTNVRDVDVYSIISDSKLAYVNMMRIKNGSIIYSFSTEIKKQLDESDSEILATIIPALHEKTESTAREAIVPFVVEDIPEDYLKQTVATRGDRKQLMELSERNVRSYQHQCIHQRLLVNPDEGRGQLMERLQKELHLKRVPVHIECFDNSNIQGAFPVAAMVRFTDGKPNRSEYRKFNIKTVEGPDDYASMAEVIYRRYKRLSDEGKELPDLLIVDGGAGQMEVARHVIVDQLQLDIPIAGLAKDDRHRTNELLFGFPPVVIGMKTNSELFHILTRIQDEVHRYAITFHRDKRSKRALHSALDDIKGIGPKTAEALLRRFKSVKRIREASLQELEECVGTAKAKAIKEALNTPQERA